MAIGVGIVIAMLGNGALNSVAVFFVPHNLHVRATWLGTVVAGVGSIVGALCAGAIVKRVQPSRLFWISLLIRGIAVISFSRATALPPAIALAIFIGVGAGVLNSAVSPIILSATPSQLLGRVSAVLTPMQQLAQIMSMALAGTFASTVLRDFHAEFAGLRFGPTTLCSPSAGCSSYSAAWLRSRRCETPTTLRRHRR